jgi:hypothetical protein
MFCRNPNPYTLDKWKCLPLKDSIEAEVPSVEEVKESTGSLRGAASLDALRTGVQVFRSAEFQDFSAWILLDQALRLQA